MHPKAAVRAGLVTGAALAGLVAAGPAALADDLDVDPPVARPGQSVTVSGGCTSGGQRGTDTYVSLSGAVSGRGPVNDGWFSVSAKVLKHKPGRYKITAKCIPSNYSQDGSVTVRKPKHERTGHPHGWAMTGGGGAQGPDVPWTPMGLALVAGAAGIGGAALLRTRSRGRA